jgi:hypothetical protein
MVKYSELNNLNFSAKLDIIIYISKAKTEKYSTQKPHEI